MVQARILFVFALVFSLVCPPALAFDPPEPDSNTGGASPASPATPATPVTPSTPADAKKNRWLCRGVWGLLVAGGGFLATYYATDIVDGIRGKAELKKKHEDAILDTNDRLKNIEDKLGATVPAAAGAEITATQTQVDEALRAVAAARDLKDGGPLPAMIRNKASDGLKLLGEKGDSPYAQKLLDDTKKEFNRLAKDPKAKEKDGDKWVLDQVSAWLEATVGTEANARRDADILRGSTGRNK